MSKPFNPHYIMGASLEQIKTGIRYQSYIKTDDEIEGIRTKPNENISPVLLSIDVNGQPVSSDGLHDSRVVQSTQ